jgi:uncharacterized membrane protein YgcG
MSNINAREIPYNKEKSPLFPNATPFSIDNFQPKNGKNGGDSAPPVKIDNDAALDNTLSALMSEYSADTGGAAAAGGEKSISEKKTEGMLTGTSLNLNLLQGDLFSYGKYDTLKNPIQPFGATQASSSGGSGGSGGIVSYKEGLTNDTVTTTTTGTTSAGKSQKLLDLEKKLSELTTDYTTQYRLYTDDLLTRSRFLQTNSQYTGKLVRDISYSGTDASAAFYYINPFGYTHRYKDVSSVILYDSKTCPTMTRDPLIADSASNPFKLTSASFIDISGSGSGAGFSRFADYASYDMVGNTPCLTAKNVKSGSIDPEYAWVDVEGKKHIYEKGVWPDKRHSSCLTAVVGEPIELSPDQYKAIPTASDTPMKAESECFRASVAPTINSKLADIKKKIDDTVAAIKTENQNILNNAANTTIIQRDKTFAEKWGNLDEDILAQIKTWLGNYYYPVVYVFWCFIILVAVLMIFKFAFLFVSPGVGGGSGDGNGGGVNGGGNGGDGGSGVSLLGVVIMSLIVIFAVYYYFSYTYNLDVGITHDDSDSVYYTST